jgi:hypothetical protein
VMERDQQALEEKGSGETHGVAEKVLDERVGYLFPAIHDERDTNGETANDLLVLRLVRVLQHLVDGLLRARAEHDEAHRVTSGLSCDGRVVEEDVTEVIVHLCRHKEVSKPSSCARSPLLTVVRRSHRSDTQSESSSVLDDLVLRSGLERILQVGECLGSSVVGVDETESEQTSSLGVVARGRTVGLGEVGVENGFALREVALVDDSESGSGGELGPVGGAREPVEVLAEEEVRGGSRVGECVHEGDRRVIDRLARLESVLWDQRTLADAVKL